MYSWILPHLALFAGELRWKTYTTVGTVSSAALLRGLVDLDVLDDQGTSVETLGIGVGLGVLQELEEELGGLDGPAGAGHTPLLAYCSMPKSVSMSPCKSREVRMIHGRLQC